MSGPAVSVVMPVYNARPFVRRAVESILAQTFGDFEFLVVDDGSTDGTGDVLREFRDPRLTVVRLDHGGVVRAVNEGIRRMRAPLFARMDADDIALPDRLREQADFMDRHPGIAMAGTAVRTMDVDGREISVAWYPTEDRHIRKFMAVRMQFANPTLVIRARCFREHGTYPDLVPEDFDLNARFLERERAANLPMPLLRYRVHAASYTPSHAPERARYHRAFRESLLRRQGSLEIRHLGRRVPDGPPRGASREHLHWLAMMQIELGYAYLLHGRARQGRDEIFRALRYAPVPRHVLQYLAFSLAGAAWLPRLRERVERGFRGWNPAGAPAG